MADKRRRIKAAKLGARTSVGTETKAVCSNSSDTNGGFAARKRTGDSLDVVKVPLLFPTGAAQR